MENSIEGYLLLVITKKGSFYMKHPSFLIQMNEHQHIEKTMLADYAFEYGIGRSAILLAMECCLIILMNRMQRMRLILETKHLTSLLTQI